MSDLGAFESGVSRNREDARDADQDGGPGEASDEYVLRIPRGGMSLDAIERDAILQALHQCGGNVSRAARFLRITRQTLTYRMKKHGIRAAPRRSVPAGAMSDGPGA